MSVAERVLSLVLSDNHVRRLRLARYAYRIAGERHAFRRRSCPLCGFHGYFGPRGLPVRHEASCPQCGSLERHRLFKIWMDRHDAVLVGRRLLHFAPEPMVSRLIRPLSKRYTSADLAPNRADIVLNIENIALEDRSVDVVVCFHVLEHVDDVVALREIRRILAPGGLLLMMTPVIEGWLDTYEDASVGTPEERELHYGQADHVRYFGSDIRERMSDAGFEVGEYTAVEPDVAKFGLLRGEKLFVGTVAQ